MQGGVQTRINLRRLAYLLKIVWGKIWYVTLLTQTLKQKAPNDRKYQGKKSVH